MLRRWLPALAILFVAAAALIAACMPRGRDPRYPKRPPGCALTVYSGLPQGAWDDIGIAQGDCYLDEGEIVCLSRLRAEACRMGGDILYNVPKKPQRPVDRAMVYRAQVAHTRAADKKDADENEEPPAHADAGAGTGPVMVLPKASEGAPSPAAPGPAPADAGGQ